MPAHRPAPRDLDPRCQSENQDNSRSSSWSRPVLPARCLQYKNIQAFRCAVHGSCESRWSGADDDHVAYLGLVDGFVKAEAVGNLLNGRIPQHHVATADHHRHIRGGHVKLVQQTLNIGVTVKIDIGVWMAVARQEFFNAECTRAMIRPDDDDISEPLRNQLDSADNECPHDDLANLAVGLHQGHQVFAIQLDHFARLTGARSDKHGTAR